MKVRLESMRYNVTDNEGEVASMSEGYKWDDEQEVLAQLIPGFYLTLMNSLLIE